MTQIPTVKPLRLITYIKKKGFIEIRQVGSHKFFKHPNGKTTVVPFHKGRDIGRGLLRSILDDCGITIQEFIKKQ